MSIKPIDFHLTYASTVKESKVKQDDFNKPKDNNQYLQVKTNQETEKKLQRSQNTEETNKKNISQEDKDRGSNQYQGKKKKKSNNNYQDPKDNKPKPKRGIGDKIDIMI